jgi:hypothetical protein
MPDRAGSGKSSLLGAALGLMQQVAGDDVEVHGGIAYVPQARAFCPLLHLPQCSATLVQLTLTHPTFTNLVTHAESRHLAQTSSRHSRLMCAVVPKHSLTTCMFFTCHSGFTQAAFIYGGATVRDNILFGLPFDEERYNHAIEVASLVDDLLQMPGASQVLHIALSHAAH